MELLSKLKLRELGDIPISYGSAMAVQMLIDSNNESPSFEEAKKEKPEELWIDLSTLERNLMNVIDSKYRTQIKADHLYLILIEEIDHIVTILRTKFNDKLRVTFYMSGYDYIPFKFPRAMRRQPKTELQKLYNRLEQSTLDGFAAHFNKHIKEHFSVDDVPYVDFKMFPTGFPECSYKSVWVMTHYMIDLLGFSRAKKVTLLESHTGRLRSKNTWAMKLTGGEFLENMPFNKMTLQVFGDGNHFFSMPNGIKNPVKELAIKYKWRSTTSDAMVKYYISTMTDHAGKEVLLGMLN